MLIVEGSFSDDIITTGTSFQEDPCICNHKAHCYIKSRLLFFDFPFSGPWNRNKEKIFYFQNKTWKWKKPMRIVEEPDNKKTHINQRCKSAGKVIYCFFKWLKSNFTHTRVGRDLAQDPLGSQRTKKKCYFYQVIYIYTSGNCTPVTFIYSLIGRGCQIFPLT